MTAYLSYSLLLQLRPPKHCVALGLLSIECAHENTRITRINQIL